VAKRDISRKKSVFHIGKKGFLKILNESLLLKKKDNNKPSPETISVNIKIGTAN